MPQCTSQYRRTPGCADGIVAYTVSGRSGAEVLVGAVKRGQRCNRRAAGMHVIKFCGVGVVAHSVGDGVVVCRMAGWAGSDCGDTESGYRSP